jgi:hypothetical protein
MARYTNTDLLTEQIEGTTWYHIGGNGKLCEGANSKNDMPLFKADDIFKVLLDAPAADVVEVVRCKDCKRSRPMIFDGFRYCKRVRAVRRTDDFCSKGEREGD